MFQKKLKTSLLFKEINPNSMDDSSLIPPMDTAGIHLFFSEVEIREYQLWKDVWPQPKSITKLAKLSR